MNPTLSVAHPTPGRRTFLTLDAPEDVLIEPAVFITTVAEDMARTELARADEVRLVEGAGWQLRPVARQEFTADDAQLAPLHVLTPTQAGSSAAYAQKQVPAGTSDVSTLDADASAEPVYSDDDGPMDRIMVTVADIQPGRPIYDRFLLPTVFETAQVLRALHFPAPPTVRANGDEVSLQGTGQWRLVYRSDGRATLEEKAGAPGEEARWSRRDEFRFCPPHGVGGAEIETEIVAHRYGARTGGYGGFLRIRCDSAPQRGPMLALAPTLDPQTFGLRIRQEAEPAAEHHPIRVDERRSIRPRTQVSLAKYAVSGTLHGDPFRLTGPLGSAAYGETGGSLRVSWRADVPAGATIVADLLDGETPLSPGRSGSDGTTSWHDYDLALIAPESEGRQPGVLIPRFTLTGSGEATPTLTMFRVTKAPVSRAVVPTPIRPKGRLTVEIQQGGDDPTGDSASFTLTDETDAHAILRERGRFVCELSTEYPGVDWSVPANAARRSVLFRGMAISPESTRRGADDPLNRHASGQWRELSLVCVGPWARLEEAYAPQLIDFMQSKDEDAASGLPWRATDAIYLALRLAGAPDEMIDVPDLPTRFFAGQDGAKLEPGASLTEFARRTAKEMFGAALVFDPNASGSDDPDAWHGMWRMILPTSGPSRPLAYFLSKPSGGGAAGSGGVGAISATASEAYPDLDLGGNTLKGTFIVRGSSRIRTRPPEANHITVVGGAPDDGGKGGRRQLVFFNAKSYDALPGVASADPAHADYSGACVPLRFVDSRLQTIGALRFVGRRLYDTLAHGRKLLSFSAPLLLVTDAADARQRRPRPLRFLDAVLVNGEAYIVRSVHPTYRKDSMQMAMYELERPGEVPVMPGVPMSLRGALARSRRGEASRGLGLTVTQIPTAPGEAIRQLYAGEYERLPIIDARCGIETDPASPRYGQPTWLLGYDDLTSL